MGVVQGELLNCRTPELRDARPPRELAWRVAVGAQSSEFSAVGGAKVKADVGASHPPIMPPQGDLGNPMSGAEH